MDGKNYKAKLSGCSTLDSFEYPPIKKNAPSNKNIFYLVCDFTQHNYFQF